MVEIEEQAIEEIQHGGDSLLFGDQLLLIERHHPHSQPGISREVIDKYVEALAANPNYQFNSDSFHRKLDSRITDTEAWVGGNRIYELESGRISRYPRGWHDQLNGETDIRRYIVFLQDEAPEFKKDIGFGGAGRGIPEQPLLDVVAVIGRIDRDDVKDTLEDLRRQGVIAEDADQHPNAGVYLPNRDDEYGDPSLGYQR
jgi:hypothetical protein